MRVRRDLCWASETKRGLPVNLTTQKIRVKNSKSANSTNPVRSSIAPTTRSFSNSSKLQHNAHKSVLWEYNHSSSSRNLHLNPCLSIASVKHRQLEANSIGQILLLCMSVTLKFAWNQICGKSCWSGVGWLPQLLWLSLNRHRNEVMTNLRDVYQFVESSRRKFAWHSSQGRRKGGRMDGWTVCLHGWMWMNLA